MFPVPISNIIFAHWPTCLHWPFCPGVFIALLGLLAVIVTFLESPPRFVKVVSILLSTVLMCCEIWMMSKDRDAHDDADRKARETEEYQSTTLGVLVHQSTTTTNALTEYGKKIDAAKGNPELIATLRKGATELQQKADAASRQLLLILVPGIVSQLRDWGHKYDVDDRGIEGLYYMKVAKVTSVPEESKRLQGEMRDQKHRLAVEYAQQMAPSMTSANYLREQLLVNIPTAEQTEEDKFEAVIFSKGTAGQELSWSDVPKCAGYLDGLAQRVAALNRK